MNKVKCDFCEYQNAPDRTTCSNCGGPLPEQPAAPQQPVSGPFQAPYQQPYGQPGYGQPGYGQPPAAYGQPGVPAYSPPPANNMVWGILTTILCCLPLGIVSIVKAGQVNSLWAQGRQAEAYDAAKQAGTWAIVAAVAGVIVGIIYFVGVIGASM